MSFFKKAGKSISSAFKKAPSVVSSIFKKGEQVVNKVGSGLDKVGDVLGKVSDVGEQILSNPLAQAAITGIGSAFGVPDAGAMLSQGLNTVKQGSQLAKSGANIARIAGKGSGAISRGDIGGAISAGREGIQKVSELRGVAGPEEPMFA